MIFMMLPYIFVLIIIILFVALISRNWSSRGIILKKFFKAKTPEDKSELVSIFVSSVIFVFLISWSFILVFIAPLTQTHIGYPQIGYKKVVSTLNQVIHISKEQDKKDASNCTGCNSDKKALATYFIKRLNTIKTYNIFSTSEKSCKKLLGKDFLDKPAFFLNDGTITIIEKAQGKCGDINSSDPNKANCVIIIDTNGKNPPNEFSTGNKKNKDYKIKDRFRAVVLKDQVVSAENEENDSSAYAFYGDDWERQETLTHQ